jgi:hypothetical protein
MLQKGNKILIVAKEAGGAEILSAWVKQHRQEYVFAYCLKEPAFSIFKRKLGEIANFNEVNEARPLSAYDCMLTGTGCPSLHEREAVAAARDGNLLSISFIDHWVNYRERFGYPNPDWEDNLPDEIWVGDKYALDLATKLGFPAQKLKYVDNPYFNEIREEMSQKDISTHNREIGLKILYLCEPITEYNAAHIDTKALRFTEYEVMDMFIADVNAMGARLKAVRIRIHPYEALNKYNANIKKYAGPAQISISTVATSLVDDCVWAEVVVGMESMGLVVGLLAGKKAISCFPQGQKTCSLPHKEIVKCNRLREVEF